VNKMPLNYDCLAFIKLLNAEMPGFYFGLSGCYTVFVCFSDLPTMNKQFCSTERTWLVNFRQNFFYDI